MPYFSEIYFTNKRKWLICMLILLCSTIIHYFINNYNIQLDIEKCPFCYGNNLCATFDNNEITFTNLSIRDRIFNLINIKNVYVANYNNTKVILKKLGHNWELAEIDNQIEKNCPYFDSFNKDFTTNILEYLMNDKELQLNLKICSSLTLNYFIDNLFTFYTHVNISIMTANIWTTILVNAEPLMLQLLNAKNDWPVPIYYGACGRIIMEEYCGKSLHNTEKEPWIIRAKLALELLKAADNFTNKHPTFRFYLTDISSDNIAVTDDNKIKFIDLENIIINEKLSQLDDLKPHKSQNFDCDNCYAFSTEEICTHSISDHNYYSICKLLLSKKAPWPMMENGLLHSPPAYILQKYPEIFDYVEICSESSVNMNRFEAFKKLVCSLEEIIAEETL